MLSTVASAAAEGDDAWPSLWVLKLADRCFPSPETLRYRAAVGVFLFLTIPPIARPLPSQSISSRIRERYKSKLAVWDLTSRTLSALSRLSTGRLNLEKQNRDPNDGSADMIAAWEQVHSFLLKEASLLDRQRQYASMTGAQTLHALLKRGTTDSYVRDPRGKIRQVPLLVDAIVEPVNDDFVDLDDA